MSKFVINGGDDDESVASATVVCRAPTTPHSPPAIFVPSWNDV